MDHLCYLCLVFVMLSHLFIAALWSPAGKGLTSWLLFVMFNCVFVTFPCGILCQVWYLIVLIFAAFLTLFCMWEPGILISGEKSLIFEPVQLIFIRIFS